MRTTLVLPLLLTLLVSMSPADCRGPGTDITSQAFQTEIRKAMLLDAWPKCIEICNAYLSKHKNDVLARGLRGFALMEYGREAQSIADFSAAIDGGMVDLPVALVEDHTNSLLSLRGFAQLKVGRLREGISDIEKSLKSPRLVVSACLNEQIDYQNLALAYSKLGNASKAAQCRNMSDECEKSLQRIFQPTIKNAAAARDEVSKLKKESAASPRSSIVLTKMTVNLIYLKDWPEALKSVDKAISLEPFLSRTHLMRLEILKNLNREADAKAEAKLILKYIERPTDSAQNAGEKMLISARMIEIYRRYNDVDGQIAVLETASNSGSAGESMYYDLGQLYAKKQIWAKAVDAYGDALEYATDNQPLILDARATAKRKLGQLKQAAQDEAEALRLRQKSRKI
jgi:tetratricopeptide (TPR) repeat protein